MGVIFSVCGTSTSYTAVFCTLFFWLRYVRLCLVPGLVRFLVSGCVTIFFSQIFVFAAQVFLLGCPLDVFLLVCSNYVVRTIVFLDQALTVEHNASVDSLRVQNEARPTPDPRTHFYRLTGGICLVTTAYRLIMAMNSCGGNHNTNTDRLRYRYTAVFELLPLHLWMHTMDGECTYFFRDS